MSRPTRPIRPRLTRAALCARLGPALLGSALLGLPAAAATVHMTPADDFTVLEAARAGDEVLIAPGTYGFRVFLTADGTAEAPITIRAADPDNPPVWDMAAGLAEDLPGSSTRGDRGRGCWQVTGDHVHIHDVVIQGCTTASGNAAGVRAIDAAGLVLSGVTLQHNQVGISGTSTGLAAQVVHSDIGHNGRVSNPPQHNAYIYGGAWTFAHNHIHDAIGGQNLHLRATQAVVSYNWIENAANYEVDVMSNQSGENTQHLRFVGNVVVTHESPANGSQVFTLYNDSGISGLNLSAVLENNTIVVRSGTNPALFNVRDDGLATGDVQLVNNVVIGTTRLLQTRNGTAVLGGHHNWLESGAMPALADTVFGAGAAGAGFADFAALDLRPGADSTLVNAGDSTRTPPFELGGAGALALRYRERGADADIGALGHTAQGPLRGPGADGDEPDAGNLPDAGGVLDAGGALDAGHAPDAGDTRDAGSSAPDSGTPGGDAPAEGCAAAGARAGTWALWAAMWGCTRLIARRQRRVRDERVRRG